MRRYQLMILAVAILLSYSRGFLFQGRFFRDRSKTKKKVEVHFVPLTDEMKQKFVYTHNLARSNVEPPAADMQMVEWDDEIAKVAQKIASKCEFKHSSPWERKMPLYPYGVGENIFTGQFKYHSDKPDYMTEKWDEERNYFNYTDLSCEPGRMCGHYTQVVWSTTTKIGCSIAKCPAGVKYVPSIFDLIAICHYGPAGNIEERKPYKEGDRCSACPPYANNCVNDFCSAS